MMATNPKLPDYPDFSSRKSSEPARVHMTREGKFPWPIVALIVGAALLVTIITVLPRSPHLTKLPSAGNIPAQPTGEQIQFTGVKIVPAPTGDSAYVDTIVHNTGKTAVTGVQVNGQFMGSNGGVAGNSTGTVQAMFGSASSENLTDAPIKPDESRPVRIYFEHTPKGWNHQVPALTVVNVTGTTL
jgi:hypothetical protein